jgi:hypothetical protein
MEQQINVPMDMIANLAGKFKTTLAKAEQKVAESRPDTRPMVKKSTIKERVEAPRPTTAGFLDMNMGGSKPVVNELADRVPDSMYQPKQYKPQTSAPKINEDMVKNSKLPDYLKEITLKYKDTLQEIQQPTPDVSKVRMDLMGGSKTQKQAINEVFEPQYYQEPTVNPQVSNMNEEHIRSLVRDEMLKMMGEEYIKKIKEETMKKTISTLKSKGLLKNS